MQNLEEYQKQGKLTFYTGNNLGSTQSFFHLFKYAPEADYYSFCNQDDYWLPDKLEVAIKSIENIIGPVLYCCKKVIVDKDLKSINQKDAVPEYGLLNALLKVNNAFGCMIVVNKRMKEIFDLYLSENVPFHDSWLYKLAIIFGTIVFDEQPHMLYRQHSVNVVGANLEGMSLLIDKIRRFDWTFKRYKNRNSTSNYAKELLNGYDEIMPEGTKKLFMMLRMLEITGLVG